MRVWLLDDFIANGIFGIGLVKPDDIAAMRHERSNVAVAEMKHAFDNFLLGFFDGALFGAFDDDGLDVFFRYFIITCAYAEYFYQYIRAFGQQPDKRVGDEGYKTHGAGHPFGNGFRA